MHVQVCVQKVNKDVQTWNICDKIFYHFCYIYHSIEIHLFEPSFMQVFYFDLIYFLRKNSLKQFYQCISKVFCDNYNLERMSPSLIVRKPKPKPHSI